MEPRFDISCVYLCHLGCGLLCFVFPQGEETQRSWSSCISLHSQSAAESAMQVACGGIRLCWLSLAVVEVSFPSDVYCGS